MKPLILAALAWTYAGFMARPAPPAPPKPAIPAPAPRAPEPPPVARTWLNAAGQWEGRGAVTGKPYQSPDRAYLESQLPTL